MNRARDQLLAGAALAAEQNGGVVGDDAADQLVNFLHRSAAADYLAADELAIHFVFQAVEIGGLRADFHRALDRGRDQIEIGERLGQVIVSAALHRLDRVVHRARRRDHDDERADGFAVRRRKYVRPPLPGMMMSSSATSNRLLRNAASADGAVDCLLDAMAVGFEPMPQNKADRGIVVGDQNCRAGAGFLDPFNEILARSACSHGGRAHGLQS